MLLSHGSIVPIILWIVWCSRNKCIFDDVKHNVGDLRAQVWSLWNHVHRAYGDSVGTSQKMVRLIAWKPLSHDCVALNVDGSVFTDSGAAGFSGLIRDHAGNFLIGFYGSVGVSCITHAKIMVLYKGSLLCCNSGYRCVVCSIEGQSCLES